MRRFSQAERVVLEQLGSKNPIPAQEGHLFTNRVLLQVKQITEFNTLPEEYVATTCKEWRDAVLGRDKNTCRGCGAVQNVTPYRIKSWEKFPLLRMVVSNGITLCGRCFRSKQYI